MNFISKANLHSAFALILLFMCFGVAQAQVPNEPTIFATFPINTGGGISFAPPSDIGGSSITNYQYSIDNGTNWNTPSSVTVNPDATCFLVIGSGLTNCTSYTIKLRAVNASGSGTASASASLTPRASIIGFNWINATVFGQYNWTSVTHGNGLFVAVSNSEDLNSGIGDRVVMTSPNGFSWSSSNSAPDNDWSSVTYGNGLFVAVANSGTGNRVMTSPNGNEYTWTSRTSAADNNWSSVTYGNGLFVAVANSGTGNRVMTSPDGITWTSRTSAADNNWNSVTYGNGLFVAVANSGTGNRVMTSPNGITWTSRTSAVDNGWHSVTYGNGLFVAVANSGTGNRVMTSPDGITWTSRTPAADNNWNSVTYGDAPLGLFVAVSDNGTGNRVMTSPDGITWTSRTSSAESNWSNVAFGNGQFVAVSSLGGQEGGQEQVMASVINVAIAADAPVISDATFGTSATTVNFTQSSPAQLPIPAITNYEYSTDNGINWAAVSPAATTSPLSISNLPSGANQIMIRAVNNAGNSCPSNNYRKICTPTSSSDTIAACFSYTWNGVTYTTSGTRTWRGTNAAGCDSVATLILTISTKTVSPLYGVTQTVISKVCSSSVYRYKASDAAVGTTYNWILPTSIGGVPGVTVDSGDINSSRTLLVRYTSNEAAFTTDSIKVRAFSVCSSNYTAVKLIISKLSVPSAPGLITVTSIDANNCSNRKYRFTAPALPSGGNSSNSTILPATGYLWSLVGNLSEFATIDSGNENSQKIVVRFSSNAAAVIGDSIKLQYLSSCGNSIPRALKLSNIKLSTPVAPALITITSLQTNVCGARKYRYTAPNLPVATTTYGAATGYVWSLVGSLSGTATIDSGNVNSQKITVTFTSNAAALTGDSIRLMYTSDCGNGAIRASKLTNTLLVAPAAPATITITALQTNVCGARRYRYTAPNLPAASTTYGTATGYVWSLVGSLSGTATIDSGNVNSQKITVTFTSNAAALTGDSIRLMYTSDCGNSARKASKLTNTLLAAPSVPATITMQIKSNECNARTYRYIAPAVLPVATSAVGAASGYLWSAPTGTVGSTGTIDSGNVNSRIITVTYSSNAAAGVGDSIRLRYTSGCGDGKIKAQKLSNLVKTGCTPISKNGSASRVPTTVASSMEVNVYPNPTTSQFNVQVKSSSTEVAVVRVLDFTGRFIKSIKVSSNSNVNIGSDLKAGAYMLEVRQGKEVKMVRVVKF